LALPLRFATADAGTDRGVRLVALSREHVILLREVSGIKMVVNLPVAHYRGVALRSAAAGAQSGGEIAVILAHSDPALSLLLCRAAEGDDIVTRWQSWSRALGLPLLIEEADGCLREAVADVGSVHIGVALPRRRRRSPAIGGRASLRLRRARGVPSSSPRIYRNEREIIARN
jgi:hypothetical protein